jgi:gas vesicle protein
MSDADDQEVADVSTTTFLAGLCAGAAIGAGLGLLFAPRPGYKLRGQPSRSATRAGGVASRSVADLAERVEAYESARDVVTHAGDAVEHPAAQASKWID